jgi:hypothetical protein
MTQTETVNSPNCAAPGPAASGGDVRLLRALSLCMIAVVAAARFKHLALPLDRDEGEYAYIGQLMLDGVVPFKLASNMKLPGTAGMYALFMALFGQTPTGIRCGFLIVTLSASAMVFLLGRRLFGTAGGWVAAGLYALLAADASTLGMLALAEHFVVVFSVGATLLLLRWKEQPKRAVLFWSGLLYGLAVLMKQPGVFFGLFGACYLAWCSRGRGRGRREALADLAIFAGAGLLPLTALCLVFWQAGVFGRALFWVRDYGRAYAAIVPWDQAWWYFSQGVASATASSLFPWLLAPLGLVLGWRDKPSRATTLWLAAFLAFSFCAVTPALYFRSHYFVFLQPAVALLGGFAAAAGARHLSPRKLAMIFAALLLLSGYPALRPYFLYSDADFIRLAFSPNPFLEAPAVADYLKAHTAPGERILIVGSEPEIYFYAHRTSATDLIYGYPLVEPQPYAGQMLADLIHAVEAKPPPYVVIVQVEPSWLYKDRWQPVAAWAQGFVKKGYETVGFVDMLTRTETKYVWDAEADFYHPRSPFVLVVYKRRDDGLAGSRPFSR